MRRVKLGEICEINIGKTPSRSEKSFWNGEFCWLSISDMKSKFLSQTKEKITDKAINNTNMKIVRKGTVVMSFKLSIGKVAILSEDMYTNEAIANFVIKNNYDILIDYLYYALQSLKFDHLGDRAVMGKTLNKVKLNNLSIVFYEPNEQRKIVDKLDVISNLIDYRQKQFKKLSNLVKSRFHEMFGDKYSEDKLLNLCNIIDYRGKTPEKVESGLPFITAKNVKMHYMSLEPREYISKETYDKVMVRGFPKEGDVLFTTEAPLGNVCRIPNFDTEFYIGQRIVTIQTDKLNSTYLEYALSDKEFIKKYMGKSSGSTVKGIRVRLLEQLTIPVPPRVLQEEFATFVLQVDKSQLAIKKSLEELETLKKSLMQAYFG